MRVPTFLAAALMFAGCSGNPPSDLTSPRSSPTLILVSLDGFHPDYLNRGYSPSLDSMARVGVRAEWMEPSFPSKTFPNHYTLVTGLRPDRHGIVSNNMWDDSLGRFGLSIRSAVTESRWWGGEPIWVTAIQQGRTAGAMFWPGSEAMIKGVYPTHWMQFDDRFPNAARVDSVLAWLVADHNNPPAVLTLYYSDVDHAGHDYGPDMPQVDSAVARVDSMIGRLIGGLSRLGLASSVNVIVVSDHGMSATSPERLIVLDDYIDLDAVTVVDWSPVAMIKPDSGRLPDIYNALKGAHPNLAVYRREEIPAELHFGTHPRVPELVLIADDGWSITSSSRVVSWCFPPSGRRHCRS